MAWLLLVVRFAEGRYHGQGDWPPSPMRLFQALVAGVCSRAALGETERRALEWLERLDPPIVCRPVARRGQLVISYVPNNDNDRLVQAQTGRRVAHGVKRYHPFIFSDDAEFLYMWNLEGSEKDASHHAGVVATCAQFIYQFGRGVDTAWAWGGIVSDEEADRIWRNYPGEIVRPSTGASQLTLRCPAAGTLESLKRRHDAFRSRFGYGSRTVSYRRPPNPLFRTVPYESPPSRQLFELRDADTTERRAPWPLTKGSLLVTALRDQAVQRLKNTLNNRGPDIERMLVGRRPDGSNAAATTDRVRIVPLPSVGHEHADMQIRRVLVEVPSTCAIRADDVYWALSGLELSATVPGLPRIVIVRAPAADFAGHYGVGVRHDGFQVWRTVTPAALPYAAARTSRVKSSSKRRAREELVAAAVAQALRHAGVRARLLSIKPQREPFQMKGAPAQDFAPGTRFLPARLWHVELTLDREITGPLVIGDGRFLGLGVMMPVAQSPR